jgi:hypothetical protein
VVGRIIDVIIDVILDAISLETGDDRPLGNGSR